MANDLVAPSDMAGLPGAPFTDEQVDAAVTAVRNAAGWHIAPTRTETAELDIQPRERWLRLPTRRLVSVAEVREADTGDVIPPESYRVSTRLAQVKSAVAWPAGYAAVEVDMLHGFAETPADVVAVVATAIGLARRDPTVRQVAIDDFSASYQAGNAATEDVLRALLGDYALDDSLYGLGIA